MQKILTLKFYLDHAKNGNTVITFTTNGHDPQSCIDPDEMVKAMETIGYNLANDFLPEN